MSSQRRRPGENEQLRVIAGGGRRSSSKSQVFFYYLMAAAMVVLILLVVYHWLETALLARRLQLVQVEPGFLESSHVTHGLVIRSEQPVCAPAAGVVVELARDGERVAAGEHLASIMVISRAELEAMLDDDTESMPDSLWDRAVNYFHDLFNSGGSELTEDKTGDEEEPLILAGEMPAWLEHKETINAEKAGLVSHYLDGWEERTPGIAISRETFEQAAGTVSKATIEGMFVEEGQPLVKLVNNWEWYFCVCLPLDPGRTIAAQQRVNLQFSFAPGRVVTGWRIQAAVDGEEEAVFLKYLVKEQLDGFERVRFTRASINYNRDYGLLVPAGALVEREDRAETGVFVNEGATVVYYPVKVLKIEGEQALVEGVPPYSLVITRPDLVREGQRLD